MELINKDTPQVKEFISSLDSMLNGIEAIVKHYKPHLHWLVRVPLQPAVAGVGGTG